MKLRSWAMALGAAALTVGAASNASAYVIEFSKYGLVDPSKAVTGQATTSPFDAEYNPTTKITDIWLSDMDGGYRGRRVFNWTLDESGGGQVWTYNGAFTTANTSGIRALNIKDSGSLLVAHGDGTIATYSRSTGAVGFLDLGAQILPTFNVGTPHHMAFDGTNIWTQQGGVAAGTIGSYDIIRSYDVATGTLQSSFTSIGTYIEGIGFAGGNVYLYNAGESVYGAASDGHEGDILKYATDGTLLDVFSYESGDRPPFHSEALSFDGTHFWMSGYTDGRVYRMAAEAAENNFGLIPEPATIALFVAGLAGVGFARRRQRA